MVTRISDYTGSSGVTPGRGGRPYVTDPMAIFQQNLANTAGSLFSRPPMENPADAELAASEWLAQMGGYAPTGAADYAGNVKTPINPMEQYRQNPGTPAFGAPLPQASPTAPTDRMTPSGQYGYVNNQQPSNIIPEIGLPADPTLPSYGGSIDDFLEQARQLYSGSISESQNSTAAREAALRQNFAESDQRISDMYAGLTELYDRSVTRADDRAERAQDRSQRRAERSAQVSQDAYADALSQQASVRESLGLEGVDLRDSETNLATEMQDDVGAAARMGQAASREMANKADIRANHMDESAGAAQLAGARQRSGLNNDLQMYLARLQDEQAQTSSSYERAIADAAMNLYNQDYSRWSDQYNRQFQADQAAREDARWQSQFGEDRFRWEQEQMAAQNAAASQAMGDVHPGIQLQSTLQNQYGIDPAQTESLIAMYQQVMRNRGADFRAQDKNEFVRAIFDEMERQGIPYSQGAIFGASTFFDNYFPG